MELRWITDGERVTTRDLAELPDLLDRTDGVLWLDIPEWSEQAENIVTNQFGFHPMAIEACRTRNHIPSVHVYPSHLFIVIHAPEIGTGGHVHYLELDQFIGERFLVSAASPRHVCHQGMVSTGRRTDRHLPTCPASVVAY